jgi:ACS family D-galactonate transporter-like MFS transporter
VWTVVLVLALGFAINYIDRTNIAVSAPLIQKEFGLDPVQLGVLFSSFFAAYALMQIPAGWLVDRLDVRWLYAAAFALWSLSTGVTAFARSFSAFLLLRIALSVGESVSLPASAKVLACEFPEEERGLANGILDSGDKFGPALGTIAGGFCVGHYGWRILFFVAGAGGLLWLLPWLWVSRSINTGKRSQRAFPSMQQPAGRLELREILTNSRAWATFVGNFCGGYIWYLMLTWLPSYLVMELHLSLVKMGQYGSLLFLAAGLVAIFAGWASDQMIRHGWSANKVRIRFAAAGLLLTTFFVPAGLARTPSRALFFLLLACGSFGFYSSNIWAITQSIAGPENIGRWAGVQNLVGNLGGVASPLVTGWVVKRTGSFQWAFVIAGAVLVTGALVYIFGVRTLDHVIPAHACNT